MLSLSNSSTAPPTIPVIALRLSPSSTHRAPSAMLHTALPTPIAASLAMDANTNLALALLTPSRQGALEVVAVGLVDAVGRPI